MAKLNFDPNEPLPLSKAEHLARHLEDLRADACEGMVSIPLATFDIIIATLRSWRGARTGKKWTREVETHALTRLLEGTTVNGLAREISATYGIPEKSAARRIKELQASDEFKELMALSFE